MLFIQAPVSPLTGNVAFNATAKVPATLHGFVRKVQFTSDFTINNGQLTSADTQHKMDQLSQEAQGEKQTDDPATAISKLVGLATRWCSEFYRSQIQSPRRAGPPARHLRCHHREGRHAWPAADAGGPSSRYVRFQVFPAEADQCFSKKESSRRCAHSSDDHGNVRQTHTED